MSFLSDMFGGSRSHLMESVNYADMFSDVVRALKQRPTEIDKVVADAERVLKKNDRVLWYLRAWKVGFVEAQSAHLPPPFVARVASVYARRADCTEDEAKTIGWSVYNDPSLLDTLSHYLALPIPQIQNRSFGNESPERLLHMFAKATQDYHADADDYFQDPDATEIMRFPNGLAWFDLNRPACDREGQSMGHGGNAQRRGSDDTLLSLRRVTKDDARSMHKPLLTFVLDKNGLLGEMKGKFNEKPTEEYYNEIVALLRDPIIHGIKGGGYKSENNFSLDDLDASTRDELLEEKPELAGLKALYETYGIQDERVMSALEERLQSERITPPMMTLDDDDTMTIQIWRDLETFAKEQDDGMVVAMVELLDGDDHGLRPVDALDDATISDIIAGLPSSEYTRVMRALQVRPVPTTDANYHKALFLAARRLRDSVLYDILLEAANQSLSVKGKHDEIEERLATYIATDWSFGQTHQWVHVESADAKVELKIRVQDLINIVTANDDHEGGYLEALREIREHHWGHIDRDETASHREEAGLSPVMNFDGKSQLDSDPFFATMMSKNLLDVATTGMAFIRKAGL